LLEALYRKKALLYQQNTVAAASRSYEVLADVVRAVLPVIVKFGLATAEEIEIETLADRLREENSSQQGVALMPALISAWTRRD
jgi:hypothetical protein